MSATPQKSLLRQIGPGVLVAATGVGAGDLITAGIAGAELGWIVIFAVIFGAAMKYALNAGIARWQLGSGTTVLEAWVGRLHLRWLLLPYLFIWGVAVATVLVKVVGFAAHSLLPIHSDPKVSSLLLGGIHSLVGLLLVRVGGYKLFERFMAVFVLIMFATVVYCAIRLAPGLEFSTPSFGVLTNATSSRLLVGLIGGVGGTLTILSYGYWIREADRTGVEGLRVSRLDLAAGYTITAIFGIAMVLIASTIPELGTARGGFADRLAGRIAGEIGAPAKWLFLIGFWGAVFSSLLGVWQSVPYMYADTLRAGAGDSTSRKPLTQTGAYRMFGWYLALPAIPLAQLNLRAVILAYTLLGAIFMFPLAISLLIMNNHQKWQQREFRNPLIANVALGVTALFFLGYGLLELWNKLG